MLAKARPFLKSGGGHRAAAGVSFALPHLPFVKGIFTKTAKSQASADYVPAIEVDGMGVDWIPNREALEQLEPYGQAWPEPSIVATGHLHGAPECFGDGHWKLRLKEMPQAITWFSAQEKIQDETLKDGQPLTFALSPQDSSRWGRSWRVEGLLRPEAAP
jgi:single-stranded-DNA-specific exonuclease